MDVRRRISFNDFENESINTDNYLTILALEDGLTASLSVNACQYCVDGDGNWIDLPADTATQSINQGQTLSFKGNLTPNSSNGIGIFTINKQCNLEGNCMSMLFGDDAVNNYSLSGKNYAFYRLFMTCTTIIEISDTFLPATTLSTYCYRYMFQGCASLTTTPVLPATTLDSYCYSNMFQSCSNLITANELPATMLAQSCYYQMFYNCTSLTTAPELPATTLTTNCYSNMFQGCTSLTTAPELPATILAANSCYSFMFYKCTSLTTAPELPATTLSSACYDNMFSSCTSLTTAPALPATILAQSCYSSMFYGCTSLTTAPELPSTTLARSCYINMFRGCSNLNYIKMLATDISANSCLNNWVSGVSSTGTFVKHPDMTSLPTGTSGIPSGWTVVDDGEESGGDIEIDTTVIQYTSTDGNVVTPSATDVFGANIVSNTYSDGKGIIKFDGDVTSIGDTAFARCSNLVSIIIPDSVTTIGVSTFRLCTSLTSVTIPDSITWIDGSAFRDCESLTRVTIPDSVTTIGVQAFYGCSSLTSVTIGDSVTNIWDSVFYGCSSLTNVYCKATTPPPLGNTYVFDNNGSGRKIYVPYQSLDAYRTATNWSEYAADIVGYDFEKNLIYNKCVVEGNTVTFDYPVATPLTLYYTTNIGSTSDVVLKDKISKNITLGPGETLISIDSISPTEDAIYVYAIVSNQNSGVNSLITFTIDGTDYQAEEGMTWEEWCNSEYNVDDFYIRDGYVRLNPVSYPHGAIQDQIPSDVICNGCVYPVLKVEGGSND